MQPETWITWQNFEDLEACPRKYLFRERGPQAVRAACGEQSVFPASRKSQRREVWADLASAFVATFYQRALWRQDPGAAQDLMEGKLREQLAKARAGNYQLDAWDFDKFEEDVALARQAGAGFVGTFEKWGLIGSRIEPHRIVSARLSQDSSVVLVSRPHLYITREDGQRWLLCPSFRQEDWSPAAREHEFPPDEVDAARWDALVSYLVTARVPDRVGIIPLRYPAGYAWGREIVRAHESLGKPLSPKTAAGKQAALAHLTARCSAPGILWQAYVFEDLLRMSGRCEQAVNCLGVGYPARVGKSCADCAFEGMCGARIENLRTKRQRRMVRKPPLIPAGARIVRLGE